MGEGHRLTPKQTNLAHELRKQCHRFPGCDASICPLDPDLHKRVYVSGLDQKCALSKRKRLELGVHLPWKGMTRKEWGYYCRDHPEEAAPYPEYTTVPQ